MPQFPCCCSIACKTLLLQQLSDSITVSWCAAGRYKPHGNTSCYCMRSAQHVSSWWNLAGVISCSRPSWWLSMCVQIVAFLAMLPMRHTWYRYSLHWMINEPLNLAETGGMQSLHSSVWDTTFMLCIFRWWILWALCTGQPSKDFTTDMQAFTCNRYWYL